MAKIDQIGLQPNSNQKVIVEELIESELERIVGGDSSKVEQTTVSTTDGSQSINQSAIQESGKNPGKRPPRLSLNELLKSLGIKIDLDLNIKA
ncbi:MAG: hypothetical protein KME49_03740 [Brasilonema octagenarum HA4186-MV1]|jgi:flagellar basal body P-ring protein FlgI|nr:hypothetical protein [Brasilonema octagenarum HA4186-MV1]